jgi:5'-nucleotidase
LTNDDGFFDDGMEAMIKIAQVLSDDVWVVAPQEDQSGMAHAITMNHPMRVTKHDEKRYSVTGTPADCVIMAVRELMDEKPDLILSGVNSGTNIGDYVNYSGTVAGAMEGMHLGIRSIALSQAYFYGGKRDVPWDTAVQHAPDVIRKLLTLDAPISTYFNVNFPRCSAESVTGVEIATQGKFEHALKMEKRHDGRGRPYYWVVFDGEPTEGQPGSDIAAIDNNKIAVTPLQMNLTDSKVVSMLNTLDW